MSSVLGVFVLLALPSLAAASPPLEFWVIDKGYGEVQYARGATGGDELLTALGRGALGGREYRRNHALLLVKRVEDSGWTYEDAKGRILVRVKKRRGGANYSDEKGELLMRRDERQANRHYFTRPNGSLICVKEPSQGLAGANGLTDFTVGSERWMDRHQVAGASKMKGPHGDMYFWKTADPDDVLRKAGVLLFSGLAGAGRAIPPEAWFLILMNEELGG